MDRKSSDTWDQRASIARLTRPRTSSRNRIAPSAIRTSRQVYDFHAIAIDDAGLSAVSNLLQSVFGPQQKFSVPSLRWRYCDNPVGQAMGLNAWLGDKLMAHYVCTPIRMRLSGAPACGLLSLNTATHPDAQGRGLFTKLAEATYNEAAERGFSFVIGIANANSTPGFIRKLGFQLVSPLAAGLLLRLPRALAEKDVDIETDWTKDLINWRLANPASRYLLRHRGRLDYVLAETPLPGLSCVGILPRVGQRGATGLFLPSLFLGADTRFELGRTGFLPIPRRLLPSPLNLIYKSLDQGVPAIRSSNINFLDFDAY